MLKNEVRTRFDLGQLDGLGYFKVDCRWSVIEMCAPGEKLRSEALVPGKASFGEKRTTEKEEKEGEKLRKT